MALFTLAWVGFTLGDINHAYFGFGEDTLFNGWVLRQAFTNMENGTFAYAPIFYPMDDAFTTTITIYGIAIPMYPVWIVTRNHILAYNIYYTLTFPLTLWATYLLVRHLLNSPWHIAMLAGLMVTYAQFRMFHVAHIETASFHLVVLCLYLLHRLLDESQWRWAVALGVCFPLTLMTSGYLAYCFIFSAAWVALYGLCRQRISLSLPLIGSAVIALVLSAPYMVMRFSAPMENIVAVEGGLRVATPRDWLTGISMLYTQILGANLAARPLLIGIIPLGLSVYAVTRRRELPESMAGAFTHKDLLLMYGGLILIGYLLTLGPNLIGSIPSPYRLLMLLPGFDLIRTTHRFIILAIIGSALLSAIGVHSLLESVKHRHRPWIFAGIALLLVFELLPPFNQISGEYPIDPQPEVFTWLAQQDPSAVVLHLPMSKSAIVNVLQFQPSDRHPMINGVASFVPVWYRTPMYNALNTNVRPSLNDEFEAIINQGADYIIVHHTLMANPAEALFYRGQLERLNITDVVYSDDESTVYRVAD